MKELTALQDKDIGLGLGKYASGCKAYLYLHDMAKPRPRLAFLLQLYNNTAILLHLVGHHLRPRTLSIRCYNIPRACLLNRSPVPAMDLKSNRSGL